MSLMPLRPISSYLRNLKLYHSQQLFAQATRKNVVVFRLLQKPIFKPLMVASTRSLSSSSMLYSNENDVEEEFDEENEDDDGEPDSDEVFIQKYLDPKDRSLAVSVETSIKYMESVAFKTTYGNDPIWKKYRRNFKVKLESFILDVSMLIIPGHETSSEDQRDVHQTGEDQHRITLSNLQRQIPGDRLQERGTAETFY